MNTNTYFKPWSIPFFNLNCFIFNLSINNCPDFPPSLFRKERKHERHRYYANISRSRGPSSHYKTIRILKIYRFKNWKRNRYKKLKGHHQVTCARENIKDWWHLRAKTTLKEATVACSPSLGPELDSNSCTLDQEVTMLLLHYHSVY